MKQPNKHSNEQSNRIKWIRHLPLLALASLAACGGNNGSDAVQPEEIRLQDGRNSFIAPVAALP